MTTEPKGLTDAWLVICSEGFDCAFSVREMANDHCNIMAAEFPQMGPWRVRRFVDAAGAASVPREPTQAMISAAIRQFETSYDRSFADIWKAMYDAAREGK